MSLSDALRARTWRKYLNARAVCNNTQVGMQELTAEESS